MTAFPYQLEQPASPALGLIVLSVDETVEQEFRHYISPETARLFVTRIPAGDDLTNEGIVAMEAGITQAASLFPATEPLSAVGFACTSGTAVLGASGIEEQIAQSGIQAMAVTDPLTATCVRADALGIRRLGIVSPYVSDVVAPLRTAFADRGIEVPDTLSFGEKVEARVARISPKSIEAAARDLAKRAPIDGLFLSCTNLRTIGLIDTLEAELGLPVLSSNHSLAWHMSRLAGMPKLGTN